MAVIASRNSLKFGSSCLGLGEALALVFRLKVAFAFLFRFEVPFALPLTCFSGSTGSGVCASRATRVPSRSHGVTGT
eukprot:6140468-Alexandrium_andersonii.AAC.1